MTSINCKSFQVCYLIETESSLCTLDHLIRQIECRLVVGPVTDTQLLVVFAAVLTLLDDMNLKACDSGHLRSTDKIGLILSSTWEFGQKLGRSPRLVTAGPGVNNSNPALKTYLSILDPSSPSNTVSVCYEPKSSISFVDLSLIAA